MLVITRETPHILLHESTINALLSTPKADIYVNCGPIQQRAGITMEEAKSILRKYFPDADISISEDNHNYLVMTRDSLNTSFFNIVSSISEAFNYTPSTVCSDTRTGIYKTLLSFEKLDARGINNLFYSCNEESLEFALNLQ